LVGAGGVGGVMGGVTVGTTGEVPLLLELPPSGGVVVVGDVPLPVVVPLDGVVTFEGDVTLAGSCGGTATGSDGSAAAAAMSPRR
jgi:hypothetical protein